MPRGPAKKCQGLFRKMEAGEEDRPVIVLMREVSASSCILLLQTADNPIN